MFDSALLYELLSWFAFLLSAGFGNPIPEEIMLVSGGIRTAAMTEDYKLFRWLMLPVCLLGGVGADVILYFLGRIFGARLLDTRIMLRLAPPEKRVRFHDNFHRYGIIIFVIGRLMPGIRTTMFLTAGSMRLNLLRFIMADGIGAIVGGGLFFLLGYALGAQFKDLIKHIQEQIHPYQPIILLTLLIAVVVFLTYSFLRHPISTGDPSEVPLIGQQIAAHMPNCPERPAEATPASGAPLPEGAITGSQGNTGSRGGG